VARLQRSGFAASALIELVTPSEDAVFAATMAFIGRHEADRTVPMFPVIPADEALDPSPSSLTVRERQSRVCRCVF
jgi:hypothetical protein